MTVTLLLAACLALPGQVAQQPAAPPAAATAPADGSIPLAPASAADPIPPAASGVTIVASKPRQPTATVTQKNTPSAAAPPLAVDRSGLTVTAWDLQLVVRPASSGLAVHARVSLRNDGTGPRNQLPLQISSSLQWQGISADGRKLAMQVQQVNTDLDHTAVANEAVVTLPTPLAVGASLTLDSFYEGSVPVDATRIEHLGAPRGVAQHTDWDRISGEFTGLRGFGSVLWYPVIADPVMLGDGARLFHAIGLWKLREQSATMRLRLRVDTSTDLDSQPELARPRPEVIARTTPRVAILNGVALALASVSGQEPSTLHEAELPATAIGFAVPSFFLLSGQQSSSKGLQLFPQEADLQAAPGFVTALEQVRPMVQQWLGPQKLDLTVLDPPDLQDSAYETQPWFASIGGTSLLVTPMLAQDPQQNTLALAHSLAHASFVSPRGWLAEGVAQFLSTLWIGNARAGNSGDPAALGALEEQRSALALAETPDPTADPGEPLIRATDDVYLRTKSAYVLWMLRDLCGDEALAQALQSYHAAEDTEPAYFQHLVEAASHKDLQWFFDDWVYQDKGLADLKIENVISHKMDTNDPSWFVSVTIANQGYATVEVPVTVHADSFADTQRVRVPGRSSVTSHALLHSLPTSVTVNNGTAPEVNASVHEKSL